MVRGTHVHVIITLLYSPTRSQTLGHGVGMIENLISHAYHMYIRHPLVSGTISFLRHMCDERAGRHHEYRDGT